MLHADWPRLRILPTLLGVALALVGTAHAKPKHKKSTPSEAPPSDIGLMPDKAPGKGADKGLNSLTLNCAPPEADVFVDGQNIGKAPIDMPVPVSNGGHTLKVAKLGYAPYIDTFNAKSGKPVHLEIELVPVSGVLHVSANIKGARVLIDGRYIGEAPVDSEMDVGARSVEVEKGCYKGFFQNVMAQAGKEESLEVKLEELPQDSTNPCYVKPLPPPKWYQKKWVWGVVAGVAVVAAGAVVGGVLATTNQKGPIDDADVMFKVNAPALLSF